MQTDLEIKRAAQLSVTEIAVGSIGHGFKVPLTGQFLSLNQLAFLLNALNRDQLPVSSVFEISGIAAVLKSFSPAGQKLGPMFSIAIQGFLFWLMTALSKKKLWGQLLGAAFLSLWSFVQPLITYFFIYGTNLIEVIQFYQKRLQQDYAFVNQSILTAFICVVSIKIIIALGFVVYSFFSKKEIHLVQQEKILKLSEILLKPNPSKNAALAALKDLLRPIFLLSFILMFIFIWQIESQLSSKIWICLRPLASAYIIFYLIRSPWINVKLLQLSKKSKRFENIYRRSKKALDLVAEWSAGSSEVSSRRQLK